MIAVDLGSNTIRFVEYDGKEWGKSFEKIVKTAESLHETGRIGNNALNRILSALDEARNHFDWTSVPVRAYATAAMRLASNSADILEEIYRHSRIRFEIIDGVCEADLTLKAVRYRLKVLGASPRSFVMADIGGGSTEVICVDRESVHSCSLNKGIVTMYESTRSRQELDERMEEFADEVRQAVTPPPESLFVLTAGTPTTMAAYLLGMDYETYDPERINGFVLSREGCQKVHKELLAMDEAQRIRYVGVGREGLIGAGILMVEALYTALGYEEAVIIDDSLREGIALDFFETVL